MFCIFFKSIRISGHTGTAAASQSVADASRGYRRRITILCQPSAERFAAQGRTAPVDHPDCLPPHRAPPLAFCAEPSGNPRGGGFSAAHKADSACYVAVH
jgi:hypothetical protein